MEDVVAHCRGVDARGYLTVPSKSNQSRILWCLEILIGWKRNCSNKKFYIYNENFLCTWWGEAGRWKCTSLLYLHTADQHGPHGSGLPSRLTPYTAYRENTRGSASAVMLMCWEAIRTQSQSNLIVDHTQHENTVQFSHLHIYLF